MFSHLANRLTETVKELLGKGKLTEDNIRAALEKVRYSLLEADVPITFVEEFLAAVQASAIGRKIVADLKPGEQFIKIVHEELVKALGEAASPLKLNVQPPAVMMVAGLQGAGKTTTVAKLAHWLKREQKKKVLLISVDIYRPAAMEQLRVLAAQVGAEYFTPVNSTDPIAIAKEGLKYAANRLFDVVIIDTAGRMHVDQEMMAELKELGRTVNPIENLLVVDSMTGQDALRVAKSFGETLAISGIILTKADGDARGGAAIAMRSVVKCPIKFLGIGEKIEMLEPFHPDRIASRILGMGDILSLVEDVYRKVDRAKAQVLVKKLQKGLAFDLEDFRVQLGQMRQLGGISGIASKLPKLATLPAKAHAELDENNLRRMEAIISSMTQRERFYPAFIKESQKKRIAAGSGTQTQEVNKLLRQFEQMQKLLGRVSGSKMKNMMQSFMGK